MAEPTLHIGRKISKIRELRGMKQETLAAELGLPAEAIKKFNEEAVINIIASTVNNHDQSASVFFNPTFNPIEKIVELYDEKVALLERLLQAEKEKNELLKRK
jgi:transcriptional regulator with XRE-family HTH domain